MQHLDIHRTDAVALRQQCAQRFDCRIVLLHVCQQQHGPPGGSLRRRQSVDLGEREGERLLAEHCDTGVDRGEGGRPVGTGGENHHTVERVALEHLLQAAVEVIGCDPELRSDGAAVAGRQVGEGHQLEEVPPALDEGKVHGLRDGTEADDADADASAGGHGIHLSRTARLVFWSAAARSAGSPGWGITSCSTTSQPE